MHDTVHTHTVFLRHADHVGQLATARRPPRLLLACDVGELKEPLPLGRAFIVPPLYLVEAIHGRGSIGIVHVRRSRKRRLALAWSSFTSRQEGCG